MPTYTNIGSFGHCDTIDTGVVAPLDGTYVLNTTFNGQIIRLQTVTLSADPIEFDAPGLNEDYQYLAYITDTTGAVLAGSYIQFTLKVQI